MVLHRRGLTQTADMHHTVLLMLALLATALPPHVDAQESPDADRPHTAAERIAQAFVEGCVLTEGEMTPAVDWAVNAGFLPVDTLAVDVRPLLAGQAGTVLAMPDTAAPVLLAVTADRGCTLWAERLPGPPLRSAFVKAVARLAAGGARVQPLLERTVERAGALREQLQMRYRRVGGSKEFAIGAVTTTSAAPAQQALHLSPSVEPSTLQRDAPSVQQAPL
jgi:hypothetical protein